MIGKLELNDLIFWAHHGCFSEERIIGNRFVVQFSATYDMRKAASSDDLEDAVNYQVICDLIAEQMAIPSNLLECVAKRILDQVTDRFPLLRQVTVSIAKINPPLGGEVGASRVTLTLP